MSEKDNSIATIAHLVLHDDDKGWAEISSGLTSDFKSNVNSFNVRYKDGSEHRIEIKIIET